MKNKNLLSLLVYFGLLLLAIFARSFVGIEILNFRIGEGLVAIGLISSVYVIYEFFKNKKFKSPNFIAILLYLNFVILIFFNGSNLIDTYVYKSSSYIWTLNYFFIGLYFFRDKFINNTVGSILLILLFTGPFILFHALIPPFNIEIFLCLYNLNNHQALCEVPIPSIE